MMACLGHSGSLAEIFSHCRGVVFEEGDKRWFEIVPRYCCLRFPTESQSP
jgi:hypothetical protein